MIKTFKHVRVVLKFKFCEGMSDKINSRRLLQWNQPYLSPDEWSFTDSQEPGIPQMTKNNSDIAIEMVY